MRLVSCHRGQLQLASHEALESNTTHGFTTGLAAIDHLLPGGAFAYGAIHELLVQPTHGLPLFFATLLARSAMASGTIVWSDPHSTLYPPALSAAGIPLDRLLLLRPKTPADELWAVAECLRCKGIRATLASPQRLSQLDARRLQLAAETGGGVGILLRTLGPASTCYAAATRWLIQPIPGGRTTQRWQLQLIHAHGGQVGTTVILEACHATNHVCAFAPVADRPSHPQVALLHA